MQIAALSKRKSMVKVDNVAHTVSAGALQYPLLGLSIAEDDYRLYGMEDLSVYSNELTKVEIELEEQAKPATGKVFKREINKSDFLVNNISIL